MNLYFGRANGSREFFQGRMYINPPNWNLWVVWYVFWLPAPCQTYSLNKADISPKFAQPWAEMIRTNPIDQKVSLIQKCKMYLVWKLYKRSCFIDWETIYFDFHHYYRVFTYSLMDLSRPPPPTSSIFPPGGGIVLPRHPATPSIYSEFYMFSLFWLKKYI